MSESIFYSACYADTEKDPYFVIKDDKLDKRIKEKELEKKAEILSDSNFMEKEIETPPAINVIDQKVFQDRIKSVFNIVSEKLSRSFGPGGAATFISRYPAYYSTKDGFNIMKNITFEKRIDHVIKDMMMSICTRLNVTVGDGTTSSIIASNHMFESFMNLPDSSIKKVLPREIIKELESISEEILIELYKLSDDIKGENLYENIRKVVNISSNGSEEITDIISNIYKELKYPAISCVPSDNVETKYKIINGFKANLSLGDRLFINNDSDTYSNKNGVKVIIFDHKVTSDLYKYFIKPLYTKLYMMKIDLICIAPFYDEVALYTDIKSDLNTIYTVYDKQTPLVITTITARDSADKKSMSDLAMLLDTTVINPALGKDLVEAFKEEGKFNKVFEEGLKDNKIVLNYKDADFKLNEDEKNLQFNFKLGDAKEVEIGLVNSIFNGFNYDKDLYDRHLQEAKTDLAKTEKDAENISVFSLELSRQEYRVHSLGLKTAIIEVGGKSDLSRGYNRDVYDDAVKAAASAYKYGVVSGCNTSLLKSINILKEKYSLENKESLKYVLIDLLEDAFKNVYKEVLKNVIENRTIDSREELKELYSNILYDKKVDDFNHRELYDILINASIDTNKAYDVTTGKLSEDIINSMETDREILRATIDLLGLLITGNQLVLCI